MKLPALLFVSLSVAAFPSALSASLNSAEEDGVAAQHDGLTELQKIDQMEFEAAQRNEAAHKNVTEEQKDDSGHHHGEDEQSAAEGDGKEQRSGTSHAPEDSESSEETEGRQRRDEITVDSTKERDGQCSTTGPSVRGGGGGGPDDAGAQGELQ